MQMLQRPIWIFLLLFVLSPVVLGQGSTVLSKNQPLTSPAKDSTSDTVSPKKTDTAPIEVPESYRIGIEDELSISIWHEPDLSTTAVVRPDGMITVPLVNDIKVIGLSTRELQALLTDKLKNFVKEPQVTIIVRQIRSRKVYLVGEVVRPGVYSLNDSKTVLQLLAEAGGPGAYAKLGSIYVVRQQQGARQRLRFNYKKAISGARASDDIELQPGDMIVVP